MKRSLTRISAGLAALALVAGACGSDDDTASDEDSADTVADTCRSPFETLTKTTKNTISITISRRGT